ncbi:3-phosphoshikimate 1-carboxyvinyltransferase [Amnibacterium sp. CER49]|uniref:3-phosphoshikimate 1-carboxyvinyltransferase n=1 Tax=Amnibacterium sp. CER49 TaxID=3039161 RepID=UPI00244AC5EF|nr:3-phosphoshikimate 1-carboxyvinyltransferase [Amnibacterium sp. CER49]MDH2445262.1 3-phosphoshikimate 1-carboxyvinyltransferase [Amnibacterium sp. CER49]
MPAQTYSEKSWAAPGAQAPLDATVRLPGSKSLTNRELVLAALAAGPSRLGRPLVARDTALMVDALVALGTSIEHDGDDLVVTPGPLRGDTQVDCGLAGTLMRFLPPLAALASGPVRFDGDERARARPMAETVGSLRALGVEVDDDGRGTLPFTVRGSGAVDGGEVVLDASRSSQFVSGLLLVGARFARGLTVQHRGGALPSLPHIAMTVDVLARRGVRVTSDVAAARWTVEPGPIAPRDVVVEPDLSNAAPFLAAALVAGGRVAVPDWPERTTQVGDRLREWLPAFGARVSRAAGALVVEAGGVRAAPLRAVDLDLGEGGELAPTLVGLAAFADGPSRFTGIGHLRGHETDRLAALAAELTALGAATEETEDGLVVTPGPLAATDRPWGAYGDHRMATTGALLGLAVPGVVVDDVTTTAKTLPGFAALWERMLRA